MDDANVRWAISYYIDREQIIDVGWSGAIVSLHPVRPRLPGPEPVRRSRRRPDRAVSVLRVQPGEGRRPPEGQGLDQRRRHVARRDRAQRSPWRSSASSTSRQSARSSSSNSNAPESKPPTPSRRTCSPASPRATTPAPSSATAAATSATSRYSLHLYQTGSTKIPGGHLVNFSRWHNDEYDALVDELYGISPTETEKVMEIWRKCMEIWLPDQPGHPDLAGPPPPADEHHQLDELAHRGEPVRQPGPLPPHLGPGHAHHRASDSGVGVPAFGARRSVACPVSPFPLLRQGQGPEARSGPMPTSPERRTARTPSGSFPVVQRREVRCHSNTSSDDWVFFCSRSGWPRRSTSSCPALAAAIRSGNNWCSRPPWAAASRPAWKT